MCTKRQRKPLAPYSRQLRPGLMEIMILTGSGSWCRAKSRTWLDGAKVILPFGEPPDRYVWPVAGRSCVLWSFGESESRHTLIRLSLELIQCGAVRVAWACGPCPSLIFRAKGAS